jgi:sec-independent protein translocase protein TatC
MAKITYPNDDHFESTKMSFGEHLEELRVALFRAVFGLVVGVLIGLAIADYVVDWIKSPLTRAMVAHTVTKNVSLLEKAYGEEFSPAVRDFVKQHRVKFETVYFETEEWRRITKAVHDESAPMPPRSEMDRDDAPSLTPIAASDDKVDSAQPASPGDDPAPSPNTDGSAQAPAGPATSKTPPSTAAPQELSITGDVPAPKPSFVKARIWRPIEIQVTSLNAQEAFMIWMKAALVSGVVLASPWVFIQIWNFVAAGLYPHEKNYVYLYLPFSAGLFLSGAALAFFFVFDPVLDFLFRFNDSMNIGIDARISEWLSFVLILPLGFGISFQLPLVMLFLNRIGVLAISVYIEKWRIAVLVIIIISAILTPADPISLLLMACPLTLLYFLGIGLCQWMPRHKSPYADAYDA